MQSHRRIPPSNQMQRSKRPTMKMKKTSSGDDALPPLALQPRDYEMLSHAASCGGATSMQFSLIFFNLAIATDPQTKITRVIPHSNCQTRLRLLHLHGYFGRIEQESKKSDGTKSYIYLLTAKGARALAERLGIGVSVLGWRKIKKESRSQFLGHLMAVNE